MGNTLVYLLIGIGVMILISRHMTNYAKHTVHSGLENITHVVVVFIIVAVPCTIIAMMVFGAMAVNSYAP